MQTPLKIYFKGMDPSDALKEKITERCKKLEKFFDHITGCQVTVELPHQHKEQGKIYSIHIKLDVPNTTLVVNKDHHKNHAHEDAYVAVRDAFDSMQRQLQDYARKMRGDVKAHDKQMPPPQEES